MTSKAYRMIGCWVGAALGLLPLLTGCVDAPAWGAWSKRPTPAQIQAVMGRPLETYIYFSRYEVYQNDRTKEYVYQDRDEWVHSPAPPAAIAEAKLQASPSVILSLRGGPDQSHTKARKEYPPDPEK